MSEIEKMVELHHTVNDYTHKIFLYYQSEKDFFENFQNPLENRSYIEAHTGFIENWRYFEKDYKVDSVFELKYKNVLIGKVLICFEEDSKPGTYDNKLIKNIKIKFEK
ncbi:hypothetical protein EUBC25_04780 [Claveliimonas bilis]|uniref:hypothetical protein n=1 Tax=Claveliimonas bilis TaxID=3028070 RepID=UPI001E4D11E4|nr:hypothetical protein [Claveliimonas bilis]BCZ26391.1 hypothetical protein EUBC25_04780 [Claveliimonas bilis]